MLKKSLFVLLILALVLVMFLPATSLADDPTQPAGQITESPAADKPDLTKFIGDPESAEDMGSPDEGSVSTLALTAVGPSKYTKSLHYDPDYDVYWLDIVYQAPASGLYAFQGLGSQDTDILIGYYGDDRAFAVDNSDYPFVLELYLEKDQYYMIELINWEGSSCTYLFSSPKALGTQAITIKSNGYSKSWIQDFTFNVPLYGLYALHFTCPASCSYYATVFRPNGSGGLETVFSSGTVSSEYYTTMILLNEGEYYISCLLNNNVSASYTYTIGMDTSMIETTGGMVNSITYTRTIGPNDTFTSHNFIPETTGVYRFACDRTDAKLTIIDDAGNVIINNAALYADIPLESGELAPNYYVYFTTPASTATRYINYSATLLSPDSTLWSLGASTGEISPDWGTEPTNEYRLDVNPDECTSLTFEPVPNAPGGTMMINGTVRSSFTIPVTAGMEPQTVYIDYTAPDGVETTSYIVFVHPLSVECSLLSIGAPFTLGANGNVATATVTDSGTTTLPVTATVSEGAYWELVGSDFTTSPGSSMTLTEGLNRAFICVYSENNNHYTFYPLYVYKTSESGVPAIFAYDSGYNKLESDVITNQSVYVFTLGTPVLSASVTKDDSPVSWADPFTEDGTYAVNATDGNSHSAEPFQFTIDKTAPVLTVVDSLSTPVANGAVLNRTVTVSASDITDITFASAKDGVIYPWPEGGDFTESGIYYITATDDAGNSSSYAFTIDLSAPVITAVCGTRTLEEGGHANVAVVVSVTDPRLRSKSVTKNGVRISWPSGGKFTYSGTYIVTAADSFNNTDTFSFTIDKTKPSITAKYAGRYTLYTNRYTKYDVTVTVKDTYLNTKTVTRDDVAYIWPENNIFTEDGKYVVTADDIAGNTFSFTFTIDKTLPTITAKTTDTVPIPVLDKDCLNANVEVTVSDTNLYGKYVKKNGRSMRWPSLDTFTASGSYVVTAKDKAGNVSTFAFVIDKVNPVISVKTTSGSTVYSGRTTKYDVYVNIIDRNPNVKTAMLEGVPIDWPLKNKFTQEGLYSITATDLAGNTVSAPYTFTIYKPARFTVTEFTSLDPVANNGYANDEDGVTIDFYEPFYASKTLTKDGVTIPWPDDPKAITVSGAGVYTATVRDTFGYTSVFRFTIDLTSPLISARAYSGAEILDEGYTKESRITVSINEKYLASKTATKNGKKIRWPSYSRFTSEGVYVITALDKAGNAAEPLTFTIDRSKPVITCKTVTAQKSIANNGITNDSAVITVTDRLSIINTLTKDDVAMTWPADNIVTEEGIYRISSVDALGYTSTFTFTIDKTKPVITAANASGSVSEAGYSNSDVTVTITGAVKKSVTKNNAAITYPSSGVFKAAGVYKVTAADAAGNKQYFTFTIDKTAPRITAKVGSTTLASGGFTTGNVTVTVTGADEVNVDKDGEAGYGFPEGGVFTEQGHYDIEAFDNAGNSATIVFYIDRTPPEIRATTDGSFPGGITNRYVTISAEDPVCPLANITFTATRNGASYPFPSGGLFTGDGDYVVTARDGAGSSSTPFTFTIDTTVPTILALEIPSSAVVGEGSTVTSRVGVSVNDLNFYSVIILRNDDPYKMNPLMPGFDESLLWDMDTPILELTANGSYVILVTDEAGNTSALTFTLNIQY